jgi:hypothetical protein
MKNRRQLSATLAVLALAWWPGWVGCGPESVPVLPGPPLNANELQYLGDRLNEPRGGFSFRMPLGWTAQAIVESSYQAAVGPVFEGYLPHIRVSREAAPLNFEFYLAEARAELARQPEVSGVEEDSPFVTTAGVKGRRWVVYSFQSGGRIWHAHYLFPGPGETKLVVSVSASKQDALRMAFVADACLKTLVIR